jgi:antitoxin ParD1/3/4
MPTVEKLSIAAWTHRRSLEALELSELRRLVREGMASGPAVPAGPVLSRLEAKYVAMVRKAKK